MKKIKLTQGKIALIDDEDFELISQHKWYVIKKNNTHYAVTNINKNNKRCILRMHRLIMNAQAEQEIDHKDGNGLNNQRNNLRICIRPQNSMNRKKRKNCSSSFKGVHWHKQNKKWQARITIDNKRKSLGRFGNEIEAAKAYDTAAIRYFGLFSRLNFIRSKE